MTPDELESVIARTGHERFRWLTSGDNPDVAQRDAYRKLVESLARGESHPAPEYPPVAEQVGNAVSAAGRFAASGFAIANRSEYKRRRAICNVCEFLDREATPNRCKKCGCVAAVKPWLKFERCPEGKWE